MMETGTHEQMCGGMGNYDIVAETSELKIQGQKAHLLERKKMNIREQLTPPLDQIKQQTGGTILGKEIYMTGNKKRSSRKNKQGDGRMGESRQKSLHEQRNKPKDKNAITELTNT